MNLPFRSVNPYTKQLLKEYEFLSQQQVEDKIQLSWSSFQKYRLLSLEKRQERMSKVREILLENVDEYAHLISSEVGKPIGSAIGEVRKSASHCQYYVDNAKTFLQHQ